MSHLAPLFSQYLRLAATLALPCALFVQAAGRGMWSAFGAASGAGRQARGSERSHRHVSAPGRAVRVRYPAGPLGAPASRPDRSPWPSFRRTPAAV